MTDETFSFLNLMNSMQPSDSLYEDNYSCFTYCYVKAAVLQGYCCIRSILCLSHCFTHTQNVLVKLQIRYLTSFIREHYKRRMFW